jgi:hypothetical protein
MKRSHIILIVMLVAVATGLFIGLGRKPEWTKPEIAVRFLGLTNDAAGTKMARFELRNVGSVRTDVSIPGFIDLGIRGGGYFGFTNATLRPGASVETSVTAPPTRDSWRAEFLCSIPLNWWQRFKNFAAGHGLPVIPVGQDATSIYSERLNPVLDSDWTGPVP